MGSKRWLSSPEHWALAVLPEDPGSIPSTHVVAQELVTHVDHVQVKHPGTKNKIMRILKIYSLVSESFLWSFLNKA